MKFVTGILALSVYAGSAVAGGHGIFVGGFEMTNDKTVVENAAGSEDHTTLVAAVTAAEMAETLSGDGPFTVLAPVNAAFDALPAGAVDGLLKKENLAALQTVLGCHAIPAAAMSGDVVGMIESGGGEATVETVGGCVLKVALIEDKVTFTDENGNAAAVTIADAASSNGVIHVIDGVLLPKQ